MSVTVPSGLRHAVTDAEGGQEWLDSIPARAARAVERWDLMLGEPFGTGMAAWTAPATTAAGTDVVVKLSYPHDEARDEAAALAAWHGAGVVEVADRLAEIAAERVERLSAPTRAAPVGGIGWVILGAGVRERAGRKAQTTMGSDRDAVSWRMRPGAWDVSGFLGDGEDLTDRIDVDLAVCADLSTTPEALGARLLDLLAEDGPAVTIESDHDTAPATCPWALERDEVCLWGPGGNPTSDRFTLAIGDRTLDGYVLSAHLIANHQFFGGIESRFRIDPVQAHALLLPEVSP